MITTRNRCDELMDTLRVIKSLTPQPYEVLITADGCTDDTVAMVKNEMPEAVLIINHAGRGSVPSRAAMMECAKGDLVLALDDDSYPEQKDILFHLSELFDDRPSLAVATFPQRSDEYSESLLQATFGVEHSVRSFPNSGACLRVSAYRSLPGFVPMFFHMYEEPDYALQCIASGWDVIFYPLLTIRHHWTPNQRSEIRNHHRHARNELWSTVMRCPMPYALLFIMYRVLSQASYASRRGLRWLICEPLWWMQAIQGFPEALSQRRSVSWKGYKKWLSLPDQ